MNIRYPIYEGVYRILTIQLQDRLYRIPIKKDIWDAGKRRADARNGMIIAGSGGGKSTFAENFTYQLLEQDYTVVVVEFGKMFQPALQTLSQRVASRGL